MSNETKRDVFEDLLEDLADAYIALDGEGIGEELTNEDKQVYLKYYDAALPDDLPVVSKDVSNTMITYRFLWWKEFLDKAYDNELSGDEDINYKVRSESAEVVRAWLLGVWRVEETGEIVKLEEEK